jgi:lactate permease
MEGGSWAQAFEVWPATLVAGGVFAVVQFLVSNYEPLHLLTDIIAGLCSVLAVVLFLRVWHPRSRFLLAAERARGAEGPGAARPGTTSDDVYRYPYTLRETLHAWVPWMLLILCVGLWGWPQFKVFLNNLIPGITLVNVPMPYLHQMVQRVPPVAPPNAAPEAAIWSFNWLSAAGTGVFVAAVLSGLYLRLTPAQWGQALVRTARRMRIPVLVIAQVLGLGFLTRYSGLDAILGLAFTGAGVLYPFFSAYLGWLGVFLTGSDTASNALFGSLQRITAEQLHLDPVLIVAANSTGGVMGKMIDAQSITVATAACYESPTEGANALGPIFRAVFWHSIVLAAFIGLIVMLQAYVVPWMIP